MSIKVDLSGLGAAMADHDFAYLLSPGRERPHVVAVVPRLVDGTVVVDSPGRSATALAVEHPAVTLVFPPRHGDGYSLIVDGDASVLGAEPVPAGAGAGDGAGAGVGAGAVAGGEGSAGISRLAVLPRHAVLHRPAAPASEPSSTRCGSDCRPLDVPD